MARKDRVQKIKRPPMAVVIGAGITEQWYFTHLKELQKLNIQIRPRFFGNEHIASLEKSMEQVLSTDGKAIVVFDTDVQAWDDGEKKRYQTFLKKYCNDSRVILCDSLPSIEYWFLLHYLNTNKFYGTSKAVIKDLVRFIPDFDKTDKFLRQSKWVESLCVDGKLLTAKRRAEDFGDNAESYTHIPRFFNTDVM